MRRITPTVPTCSLSTLIGLAILSKCRKCLPLGFKVCVGIKRGTHDQAEIVNRQLSDKERVLAALENPNLLDAIRGCVEGADLLPQDWVTPILLEESCRQKYETVAHKNVCTP